MRHGAHVVGLLILANVEYRQVKNMRHVEVKWIYHCASAFITD